VGRDDRGHADVKRTLLVIVATVIVTVAVLVGGFVGMRAVPGHQQHHRDVRNGPSMAYQDGYNTARLQSQNNYSDATSLAETCRTQGDAQTYSLSIAALDNYYRGCRVGANRFAYGFNS
jgi:hypothetical protein